MNAQRQQNLLQEYQANIELWKHDDNLRQHRAANFLTLNTILIASGAVIGGQNPKIQYFGAILVAFALVGFAVNLVWNLVSVRNSEYIRFRRYQLRSVESQLEGMSTFENTFQAFYESEPINFEEHLPIFEVSVNAKRRSTLSEENLPLIMRYFWFIIGVLGAFLVYSSLIA